MPSIVSYDESKSVSYAEQTDDVKSIRRDCQTIEDWQSSLLRSLIESGWTCGMLLYLPAPLPIHWVTLLRYETNFRLLDEQTFEATRAYSICGHDRRLWMALACKALEHRGWSPTMMSKAWRLPKTNIYRCLLYTSPSPRDS